MSDCPPGPKGITVKTCPGSVAKSSYAHPPCHAYGYEWPQVAGNPPCMTEPEPEPSRCPEVCPSKEEGREVSPCPTCLRSPCYVELDREVCKPPCSPEDSGDRRLELPPPPPTPPAMSQPFPPPPLGPRMLRCHHPSIPSVAPHPQHAPCSLPFPQSCLRISPVPKSTLTSKSMRAALMPYDHLTTVYRLDFCYPPGLRHKQLYPCPNKRVPLGKSAGIIREYVGKCGGGPKKPPPRRVFGVMGPPPCRYSFGRTEYQSKVGRLGGVLLKCHAKRASCRATAVPYGTVPPCRPPCHPPCSPPCAPPPPCPCNRNEPCPRLVYLNPCQPGTTCRPSRKCAICK